MINTFILIPLLILFCFIFFPASASVADDVDVGSTTVLREREGFPGRRIGGGSR